jgi:hypothetical protein
MTDYKGQAQSGGFRIKKTEYKLLPPDTYTATIAAIVVQPATNPDFGDQLRWRFDVDDLEGNDVVPISGWTSLNYSSKSRAFEWTQAALGVKPEGMPDELTAEVLTGKRVRVLVIVKNRTDGTQSNKVDRVLGKAPEQTAEQAAQAALRVLPEAHLARIASMKDVDAIPF